MSRPRKSLLVIFLFATFSLSWGIILLRSHSAGNNALLGAGLPPLGMLMPAFVALGIEIFFARESRIYFRNYTEPPRLILFTYLLLTLLVGFIILLEAFTDVSISVLRNAGNMLFILWTLLLIRLYRNYGEKAFKRAGLQLGDTKVGKWFVIGIVLFLLLQAGLNWAFGFGEFKGINGPIEGIQVSGALYIPVLIAFLFLTVIGTPLGGLAATFGEEYAWRGFLQRGLERFDRRRGVLLIGLIWGIWHIPIILSGVHTYPPTSLGFLCALVFFILWGYVQSYAVLKTGSIWVAAFLHGVVNSVYAFSITYFVRPENKLFSFGLGIYGLVLLFVVVLFILRDPIWKIPVSIRENL